MRHSISQDLSSHRTSVNLLSKLQAIVGRRFLIRDRHRMAPYVEGYRYGQGPAIAVVRPGSLRQLWQVLEALVEADVAIILQAANTGLTGGSTPFGSDYGRHVVLVSTQRLSGFHLINEGKETICLPGTTLHQVERALAPIGREPHSVIGSSCIGASVVGGICNSSGGALVRRGPAYTELALFARLTGQGELQLVNHLGVSLSGSPEEQLDQLESGKFGQADVHKGAGRNCAADYELKVRDIDRDTPARFNADPDGLHEASGSAGKVAVLAVRLATFPKESERRLFYIGTNDPAELTQLRRDMLGGFKSLPVVAEYLHRQCFNLAEEYGKDNVLAIRWAGTARLPMLFAWKARFDRWALAVGMGASFSDRVLQRLSRFLPSHLPRRLTAYRDRFEHHLLLEMADDGIAEAREYLEANFPSPSGDYFECSEEEAGSAKLHRFAAAGAAIRYRAIHAAEVEDLISLDFALRRNDQQWTEMLPADIEAQLAGTLKYGHFFCHVFHHDYLVRKGCDAEGLKTRLLEVLDQRRAEYPAEHNVGHLYRAKPELARFYRSLDPTNSFNPGIGQTSNRRNWA